MLRRHAGENGNCGWLPGFFGEFMLAEFIGYPLCEPGFGNQLKMQQLGCGVRNFFPPRRRIA